MLSVSIDWSGDRLHVFSATWMGSDTISLQLDIDDKHQTGFQIFTVIDSTNEFQLSESSRRKRRDKIQYRNSTLVQTKYITNNANDGSSPEKKEMKEKKNGFWYEVLNCE